MAKAEEVRLKVRVVYLRPGLTFERALLLRSPATVAEAIEASGILAEVAELRRADLRVGVFSRLCAPHDLLRDGDRVELYRPLTLEPKEARRLRAAIRRRRKGTAAAAR